MNKIQQCIGAAIAALSLAASFVARADDTDIYVDNASHGGKALVMFSIDYRANLNNTDSAGGSSFINYKCQLNTVTNLYVCDPTDKYAPMRQAASQVSAWKTFDTIRFGLWAVLLEYREAGLYIGLMLNHANENNCAGPAQTNCSNGGMILMGFQQVTSANNYAAVDTFMQKLNSLAVIRSHDGSSAADHPYQGKELFFELFRYLTGQGVYNGHNGWTDFEQGGGGVYPANNGVNRATNNCQLAYGAASTCVYDSNAAVTDYTHLHLGFDDAIENSTNTTYVSPILGLDACSKIFTINFMFQVSQAEDDSNTALLASGTGLGSAALTFTDVISILYQNDLANGSSYNPSLNLGGVQNVTSYFFVPPTPANSDPAQFDNTTTGYANAGGTTTPYPLRSGNNDELTKNLGKILSDILSVSTTFVAAAIPANVFNRAQSLDNLYIALFQPSATSNEQSLPFWNGDLKKLKLVNGVVKGSDNNATAVNTNDGRIANTAISFWTNTSKLDNNLSTTSPTDPTAISCVVSGNTTLCDAASGTDGRQVNRGGAGQNIPGYKTGQSNDNNSATSPEWTNTPSTARKVFYDPTSIPSGGAALLPLNVNNSATAAAEADLCTSAVLGVTATVSGNLNPACEQLLTFMRGIDPSAYTTQGAFSASSHPPSRKWMMGDPLHSRPVGINYGAATVAGQTYTSSNAGIFIAVGGNDGVLHLFQNTLGNGTDSGKEMFAFIPKATMKLNPQGVNLHSVLKANAAGTAHPYGLDGAPVVYVKDSNSDGTVNNSDKVYLYIGMRRGGYSYYALDITDPTTPRIQWRIDNTGDFAEMGQTFSTPKLGYLKVGASGTKTAVLFFGGGYNGKDANTNATGKDSHEMGTDDSIGNAIYVVDATTGALIWKAKQGGSAGVGTSSGTASKAVYSRSDLLDSIPSDVAIMDSNGDGLVDRLVVGDTGGGLWRADFAGSDATKWTLTSLGQYGRHGVSGTATHADDRRFFYPPEIVQTTTTATGGTDYDAVLIGTGDREDPLDKAGNKHNPVVADTNNYFYAVRDTRTGVMSLNGAVANTTTAADLTCSGNACTTGSMVDITSTCVSAANCTATITVGWKLLLNHTPATEKCLASPLAFNGVVYFTTYIPPGAIGNSCGAAEGTGLQYAVNLADGSAAFNYNTADGNGGNSDTPNTAADRVETFAQNFGGIPAQDVFITGGNGVTPQGKSCIFQPGLKCEMRDKPVSGRTFWQRLEQVPQ